VEASAIVPVFCIVPPSGRGEGRIQVSATTSDSTILRRKRGDDGTVLYCDRFRFQMMRYGGIIMKFERITVDPEVCTGKPCIRGLRFPVSRLLGLLAAGESRESILKAYPYLESGDVDEALRYAVFLAEEETVELSR
jgi:uncharacterized protein (DUF433 family)